MAREEMTAEQSQAFANSLRECLGLDPLYGKTKPENQPWPWWAPYLGTGNRQVRPKNGRDISK